MAYNPPKATSDKCVTPGAEKVKRTSAGLREMLFEEIDLLRSGESDVQRANAIGKLASGVVETVRMEIDVSRFLNSQGAKRTTLDQIKLGEAEASLQLGESSK